MHMCDFPNLNIPNRLLFLFPRYDAPSCDKFSPISQLLEAENFFFLRRNRCVVLEALCTSPTDVTVFYFPPAVWRTCAFAWCNIVRS